MRILHLGCGQAKFPGAIGIDINPRSQADVLYNLDQCPYPFIANSFDQILCEHVLEHLEDVVKVMDELHRLGRPGATVIVRAPHFSSVYYYSDPTHKHPFGRHSFDYFIPGTPVHPFHYSDSEYRLARVTFPPPDDAGPLKRAVFELINRYGDFYERRLAFILPRHLIEYELEVVKDADRY